MKIKLAVLLSIGLCQAALASKQAKPPAGVFYVYADKGSGMNHFIPSGWMGDYGDMKLNDAWKANCIDGETCIQIVYNAKGAQGANWAGIFWQHPANNWGDKPGGFDMSGFKRLTFWARGDTGEETIAEFGMGGITGENPDSASNRIGPIHLTKDWMKYTVDLKGLDLKHMVGGFVFATNKDYNPNGMTMYLDEIRYEK